MSIAGGPERLRVALTGKVWPSGQPVLGPIAFTLHAGEVVALSGPSGCGKSTLLGILAGLDTDVQGTIWRSPGLNCAVVFQEPRLLPWRTAAENIALALGGGRAARRRAVEALESMGLGDAADRYPARLSLGMARRVSLARALAVEPDLLLLDEPFVSLDEATVTAMREAVRAEVARRAMAVLLVSHDSRDLAALADRVLRLEGRPATLAHGPLPDEAERVTHSVPQAL